MRLPERLSRILSSALDDVAPTKDECVYLANSPERSLESRLLAAVADGVSGDDLAIKRSSWAEIGIRAPRAPVRGFCALWDKRHTQFPRNQQRPDSQKSLPVRWRCPRRRPLCSVSDDHDYFALHYLLEVIHTVCFPPDPDRGGTLGTSTRPQAASFAQQASTGVSRLPSPRRHRTCLVRRAEKTFRTIRGTRGSTSTHRCEPIGRNTHPQNWSNRCSLESSTGVSNTPRCGAACSFRGCP